MNPEIAQRLKQSATDFIIGVQPTLESRFKVKIYPVEDLQGIELAEKFDQSGIDAFYMNKNGSIKGLASRVNYHPIALQNPQFTFRYGKKSKLNNRWDYNQEFNRKLHFANNPLDFNLFPKIHVESYSSIKGLGRIVWSFAAETKTLVNFIKDNIEDKEKVRIFRPTSGEERQVISISVEDYARDNVVYDIAYLR